MPKPSLSVIIPTRNRWNLLEKLLMALNRLRCVPNEMEVIVVDDGSTDGTADKIAAFSATYPLHLLRHKQSQGPATARNDGVRTAQGEILGFLDSDVCPFPDWWQQARLHFHDSQVAGVEGATLAPSAAPRATPFTHTIVNRQGGRFLTCNIFYRRQVLAQIGGFDERFRYANREDTDLAFSALERGWQIVFEPLCRVEHPLLPASRCVYFQEARYGWHEALLRRKHPQLYHRYLKWIDGRAFPIFYWGIFLGLPLGFWAGRAAMRWLEILGWSAFFLGWAGSVYALCHKRKVSVGDLVLLVLQFVCIPWLRLYWVLRGEWQFRKIKPVMKS